MNLIVNNFGSFIGKKSERLVVKEKGKVVQEVPFFDLVQVTIATNGVSLSSDAVRKYLQPVRQGFLYLIPVKTIVPVEITPSMREQVKKVLSAIRQIVASEKIPGYIRSRQRCTDCEYRNYCADLE